LLTDRQTNKLWQKHNLLGGGSHLDYLVTIWLWWWCSPLVRYIGVPTT